MTKLTKPFVLAGAIAGLALLPACSSETAEGDETATQDEATLTLAASLNDMPDMATLNGAISEAQLGSIFDGPGSYTLLAPNDSAFEALGDEGATLLGEDQYFVMGDNRGNSHDSRSSDVGPISRGAIMGHVKCVLFPFSSIRGIE